MNYVLINTNKICNFLLNVTTFGCYNFFKTVLEDVMKKTVIKFLTVILLSACVIFCLASCSNNDKELLCAHPWESAAGFYEFCESGKICYNFESEDTSVSYYKLLSGKRINMYTEEGEDMGMIFDYQFRDGKLYIGNAEYKKAEKIDLESLEKELAEKKQAESNDNE